MNLIRPRSIVEPVWRDDVATRHDPVLSGRYVKHWDGRQDATVFAPTLRLVLVRDEIFAVPNDAQRELLLKGVRGGAFAAASGIYTLNMVDVFDATQLAFAYLADTVNMALYTNSIAAMSYYADIALSAAPYNANQASGTGYTAGGLALSGKTVTQSPNGTVMFDASPDPAWTITGSFAVAVRGAVVNDSTIAANGLFCAIQFGNDYNVTNGTFTVQLNSLGMATIQFAA